MAYTQADLDAIRSAIASGELVVRFESGGVEREVRYRSIAELQRAEAAINASLTAQAGGRPKQYFGTSTNGLSCG